MKNNFQIPTSVFNKYTTSVLKKLDDQQAALEAKTLPRT